MNKTNKNFLYSIMYQIFVFIFPLVITPYISRVLGVDNIGKYSFTFSIVTYFMLFALLGINNYGVRTIAKSHDNRLECSKKFIDIYSLQFLLSLISMIIYIISIFVMKDEYKVLMSIQFLYLLSTMFDINWLFQGFENFKLSISRNIFIKIFSLIFIFVFVKDANDIYLYAGIMSLSALISQLYMWCFVKKYVDDFKISFRNIKQHLKPCIILFIPVIAYSVYRLMDKIMLGGIAGNIDLGNYDSAEKIINIPLMFIIALGSIMLPHVSKVSKEKILPKVFYSFRLCFLIVVPITIGLFLIAKDFSLIFFGDSFTKTPLIIQILSITIIFASIANVIRTNFLLPLKKDRIYIKSTIVGAVINLVLNLIFIPVFGVYGACIGTVVAEFTVMAYQVFKTKNDINYLKAIKILFEYIFKSIPIVLIIVVLNVCISDLMLRLILQITLSGLIYSLLNYKFILYEFLGMRKNERAVKC